MGKNGEVSRMKLPPGAEIVTLVRRLQQTQRNMAQIAAVRDTALQVLQEVTTPIKRFLDEHGKLPQGQKLPVGEKLYEALCKALPPPSPPIGLG